MINSTLAELSVSNFVFFFFWFWFQENEKTNELKKKLEELSQMYESTVDELQTVKLDYDDLLHQKV